MKHSQKKAFTLVELLVVIVILGILMALLLPAIAAAIKNAKITNCSNNLNQLAKAMYNYSISKSKTEGSFPTGANYTGKNFWLELQVQKEVEDVKLFSCPVGGITAAVGDSHYAGASGNSNVYKSSDAIGADNRSLDYHGHSGDPSVAYSWVAKSGDVHKLPSNNTDWTNTIETKVN